MKLVYVDSSIWINRVEGNEEYRSGIDQYFSDMNMNGLKPCVSGAVTLEVLLKPQRDNNINLIQKYKSTFESSYQLSTYTQLFQDALKISLNEKLKAIDAIHVAFALHYECEQFVTADLDFQHLTCIPVSFLDLNRMISK